MKHLFALPLLLLLASPAFAQQTMLRGTVLDSLSRDPLPGVNVVVKGTIIGTATDVDGRFSFEVRSLADTLQISYISFNTKLVPIAGRTNFSIRLQPDVITQEEVVVIGYGTIKAADVTGAISTVGREELDDIPVPNLAQALQGRVAGVEVQQTSTRPGQTGQIRIRGTRSLTASNNPLLVVDDVPFEGSINGLNPSNIQSIQVLKDASATAIYGSRGANGVIIVTTRRGSAGRPQVTYNAYQGINTVSKRYETFSGPEFIALRETAGFQPYTEAEQAAIAADAYTDWQDLLYQNGVTIDHHLNVSGGTESTTYSFGGGYYNESAVTPGIAYERYSLNASIRQDIGSRLNVGFSSNSSHGISEGESASFIYPILTLTPISPAYDENGEIANVTAYPNEDYYSPLLLENTDNWIYGNGCTSMSSGLT